MGKSARGAWGLLTVSANEKLYSIRDVPELDCWAQGLEPPAKPAPKPAPKAAKPRAWTSPNVYPPPPPPLCDPPSCNPPPPGGRGNRHLCSFVELCNGQEWFFAVSLEPSAKHTLEELFEERPAARVRGRHPEDIRAFALFLNSAPYTPCWYTRDSFFSLMLAMGPRVLNSARSMLFGIDQASFCRWVVFRGVPGINNVIIGAVRKGPHCERFEYAPA